MLHLVRTHVYLVWKLEIVVDFAALECAQIEVEPLQMKNQIVRNVFQARSGDTLVTDIGGVRASIPLYSVNMAIAGRALIFVV